MPRATCHYLLLGLWFVFVFVVCGLVILVMVTMGRGAMIPHSTSHRLGSTDWGGLCACVCFQLPVCSAATPAPPGSRAHPPRFCEPLRASSRKPENIRRGAPSAHERPFVRPGSAFPVQRCSPLRRLRFGICTGLQSNTDGAAPTPQNQGTEAPLHSKKVCYRLSSLRAFDW